MGRSKQAPYARAGVDADRAGSALKDLTALLRETFAFRKAIGRVMLPFGYFANVIALGKNLGLALSTDGVGTKILVAQLPGRCELREMIRGVHRDGGCDGRASWVRARRWRGACSRCSRATRWARRGLRSSGI